MSADGRPSRKTVLLFLCKGAALLCALLLLLDTAGALLSGGQDMARYSSSLDHLPKSSVDVLFLGSSHAFCGFIPQRMYDQYGIRSTLAASAGMNLNASYWMLRYALQRQTPRVVVLDVFFAAAPYASSRNGNAYALRADDILSDPSVTSVTAAVARRIPLFNGLKPGVAVDTRLNAPCLVADLASFTRFKSRYASLRKEDFDNALGNDELSRSFGYQHANGKLDVRTIAQAPYSLERMLSTPGDTLWEISDEQLESAALHPSVVRELKRMIDYTQSRGVSLVLCSVPYITNRAEDKLYSQLAQLAQEENVTYLGKEAFAGLNEPECLCDMGHLNILGAQRFTDLLAGALREGYSLPDRRQEQSALNAVWESRSGSDADKRAVETLDAISEPDEYLRQASALGNGYLVMLLFRVDEKAESLGGPLQTLYEAISDTGGTCAAGENALLAGVLCGGRALCAEIGLESLSLRRYLMDHQLAFAADGDTLSCMVDGKTAATGKADLVAVVYELAANAVVSARAFDGNGVAIN